MPQTNLELPWHRQNLRVPRMDETLFARPELPAAVEMAHRNHEFLAPNSTNLQGRTLEHLRRWARDQVLEAARQYTSELLGESLEAPEFERLYVAGHQPSLFHPGVWVKNFAIHQLAARDDGLALNLVVDNDTFSSTSIRVPRGDRNRSRLESIAFDEPHPMRPWEDATILSPETFRTFPDRVAAAMADWGLDPLVRELWPAATECMARDPQLVSCLAAARIRLEHQWGLSNWELPISALCRLDPFLWFAGHLFAQLPRFRDIHNEVLAQYRIVNRVRSRTHPVPELTETDGWFEAPFWIWRSGDSRRSRVFARQVGREVLLSDGEEQFARMPLAPEMDACCAVEALRELPERGLHLRTRALTTTLFSRLCLGDLFVHGIGGSKYDEMTDRIIARFFGLRPPGFLTLSATLHLPLAEAHPVTVEDERRLRTMLRDLDYNSQRHLPAPLPPAAAELTQEKARLIEEQHEADADAGPQAARRGQFRRNYARYRRIREINRQLAAFTSEQRRNIEEELATVREQLQANAILEDREFSFCLFPVERIRPFMDDLWNR